MLDRFNRVPAALAFRVRTGASGLLRQPARLSFRLSSDWSEDPWDTPQR